MRALSSRIRFQRCLPPIHDVRKRISNSEIGTDVSSEASNVTVVVYYVNYLELMFESYFKAIVHVQYSNYQLQITDQIDFDVTRGKLIKR